MKIFLKGLSKHLEQTVSPLSLNDKFVASRYYEMYKHYDIPVVMQSLLRYYNRSVNIECTGRDIMII